MAAIGKGIGKGIGEDQVSNEEDIDTRVMDEEEAQAEEFADDEAEVSLGEFEAEGADDEEAEIDEVVELTSKEQSARSLEIRRAIERRMEERQLHEDLDYLDLDEDD